MRLRKSHSDAGQSSREAGAGRPRGREGRGWGPFTGGQLTVVIVAIAAMVAIPTAALAGSGVFTSASNTTPAVKATNTGSAGIGVQGTGKKFGVLSNGPLGVAAGKKLSCRACVTPGALSSAAKGLQPLASGQSESGLYSFFSGSSASGNEGATITFARPVMGSYTVIDVPNAYPPVTHCAGKGSADPGYLCLYDYIDSGNGNTFDGSSSEDVPSLGVTVYWFISGLSEIEGEYTITAP